VFLERLSADDRFKIEKVKIKARKNPPPTPPNKKPNPPNGSIDTGMWGRMVVGEGECEVVEGGGAGDSGRGREGGEVGGSGGWGGEKEDGDKEGGERGGTEVLSRRGREGVGE